MAHSHKNLLSAAPLPADESVLQAQDVRTTRQAHSTAITALCWLPEPGKAGSATAARADVAHLVTGCVEGQVSVWSVDLNTFEVEHITNLQVAQASQAAGAHAPQAVQSSTDDAGQGNTCAGPVTCLTAWSTNAQAGSQAEVLLAATASDGHVHVWQQGHASGQQQWRAADSITVPRGIVQHCAAFSHIPGHPDWCAFGATLALMMQPAGVGLRSAACAHRLHTPLLLVPHGCFVGHVWYDDRKSELLACATLCPSTLHVSC